MWTGFFLWRGQGQNPPALMFSVLSPPVFLVNAVKNQSLIQCASGLENNTFFCLFECQGLLGFGSPISESLLTSLVLTAFLGTQGSVSKHWAVASGNFGPALEVTDTLTIWLPPHLWKHTFSWHLLLWTSSSFSHVFSGFHHTLTLNIEHHFGVIRDS